MLAANISRGTSIFFLTLLLAGCGGGGGGGGGGGISSTPPPSGVKIDPQTSSGSSPTTPTGDTTLWLGNVTTLAAVASLSDAAPTTNFGAWINTTNTTATTYYVEGRYSNVGIDAIQGAPGSGNIGFTVQFRSPKSIGVGTYTDSITMEGCYDSACSQQVGDSPQTITVTYTVEPDPVSLTSISPAAVLAGSPTLTLTLTGTGFSTYSVVQLNYANVPTTFVSPTQLTATIDASLLATAETGIITVASWNKPYAQVSGSVSLQVVAPGPDPAVTTLSPNSVIVGSSDFTLTVNGTNFIYGSQILWGGTPLPTTFLSNNQMTASIKASQVATVGTVSVSVQEYANATSPISNAVSFTVAPVPPLTLVSVYPSIIPVGASETIVTAVGLTFAADAVIRWNGTPLATTVVSSAVLRATIPAANLSTARSASITVQNPSGAGTTSAAVSLSIQPPTKDAVAEQITPDHAGAISFNAMSSPSSKTWSVDLGGQPSFALLADGKVFVTVKIGAGESTGSNLIALDQATGNTVWGPIQLGEGWAFPAYDGGKIFVVTSWGIGPATLQSYDGKTGSLSWSTTFQQGLTFESAPTAANGFVYLVGSSGQPLLYGIDAGSGATVWRGSGNTGNSSNPAVTPQGVYMTPSCATDGFAPLTGTSLFAVNGSCSGGGGTTAVVANNVLYSLGGDLSNSIYVNATTGVKLGTFTADAVPAISATQGFFLQSGTLNAKSLTDYSTEWSFAGDGGLITSPLIVGSTIIIGSSSGRVYGLDAASGTQLWSVDTGATIVRGGNVDSGLSAGDGLLVVPAGNTLSAYTLSTNP